MSYVPPPASVSVYFPANEVCSISHEPFPELYRQNRLVQASCQHFFDRESINTWMRQKPTCPLCKRNITIVDVRIEQAREESLLSKLGRVIMTILEILWKGIVFLCEVSILSNSSYTSHRTVYVAESRRASNSRMPRSEPMYVPPPAGRRTPVYVSPSAAGSVRNGRVVLGTRAAEE